MRTLDLSRTVRGSTVLITGAASGMGLAAAHVFAADGANVAVTVTDRDAGGAAQVAEAIMRCGGKARSWTLDVSDDEAIEHVVADVAIAFRGLGG